MIGYAKYFDSKRTMSFKVIDKETVRKVYSELIYGHNDQYIKAKIRAHGDKVNTNFQGNKIQKENTSCKCLSLIMLQTFRKYLRQTLVFM